jgi:DNA-binding NtrC family response regulator
MILVVDDDKVITRLLRNSLEDAGYEVRVANDGEEAYQHLKDPKCKCMLLDMRMPGINGAELLMLMSADNIRVPVIVMSANPDFSEQEMKEFGNVKKLFHKPFYTEEMLEAVKQIAVAGA